MPEGNEVPLIAQACADPAGALDPRMVHRDGFAFAGYFFERHGFGAVPARGDHDSEHTFVNQIGACGSQARGEESIRGGRRAATLHVTENGDARLQIGQFFELSGHAESVAHMFGFQRVEFGARFVFRFLATRFFAFLLGLLESRRVVLAHRSLGHGHDAEVGAAPAAAADGFGNLFYVVRNFGNQDDVSPASDAERVFTADPVRVPPLGTEVLMLLGPAKGFDEKKR